MDKSLNLTEDSYRLVLTAKLDGTNEEDFLFDDVKSDDVDCSTTITEHPLLNGDSVSDHMYRQPTTVNIAGTFSLNGNKPTAYSGKNADRLTNIQEVFETLMHDGIFCRLTTISTTNKTSTRFKIRENMILNSIRWSQGQNNVNFTFGFREAMTASVVVQDVVEDATDPSLPSITEPSTLDFSDTLINWNDIYSATILVLTDYGLISKNFLEEAGKATLTYSLTFVGVTSVVFLIVAKVCVGLAVSAIPVGVIIAAVVGIATGIAAAVVSIVNWCKKKSYYIQAFNDYYNDQTRFYTFMQEIYDEVAKIEDYCKCYSILSDKNQECALYIDGAYYVFTFIKGIDGYYVLTVTDVNDEVVGNPSTVIGLQSISECNNNNAVLTTTTTSMHVYLISKTTYNLSQSGASSDEIATQDKILTNTLLFVTSLDMTKFNDLITEIIKNKIGC